MAGPHEEILQGLLEYSRFPHAQGFAVVLNGPWLEDEDCKIIILADETQFKEDTKKEYEARKEKTMGRTFEFRPDVAGVYEVFLHEIDDASARGFLANSAEAVRKVFADSKYDNLRLLKQFMWDFERVWKSVTLEQRECQAAMHELLELLCASALELRHGQSKIYNSSHRHLGGTCYAT
jgi:hypothetical protein